MRTGDPQSFAGRPTNKTKRLGQVITPGAIAERMVVELLDDRPSKPVSIMDPCVGPMTFPSQMQSLGMLRKDDVLTMVDLDEEMIAEGALWNYKFQCTTELKRADYLSLQFEGKFDYAILNPPYLRQEWLDKKETYRKAIQTRCDLQVPGTSNLYVYFLIKVLSDLKVGGKFASIVYDSWQSTRYGRWLQSVIEGSCSEINVVPLPRQPFNGALIDATLIFGKKASEPGKRMNTELLAPEGDIRPTLLSAVPGCSPIGEMYKCERGLRLKQADFFLCDLSKSEDLGATPFIKKVGRLSGYTVPDTHEEGALLLTVGNKLPLVLEELRRRLSDAEKNASENESILTWYRERPESWMVHKSPPYAPILFNYYMRKRPKHIFNKCRAFADNFYGLTVPESVPPFAVLAILNSTAVCVELLSRSRNQGNGLAKLQLFEYRGAYAPNLSMFEDAVHRKFEREGRALVENPNNAGKTIKRIDTLIADIFDVPQLRPLEVEQRLFDADTKARRSRNPLEE